MTQQQRVKGSAAFETKESRCSSTAVRLEAVDCSTMQQQRAQRLQIGVGCSSSSVCRGCRLEGMQQQHAQRMWL